MFGDNNEFLGKIKDFYVKQGQISVLLRTIGKMMESISASNC